MSLTWAYAAVVYFGAVWLGRRAGVEMPWRIALFFFALTLAFMWVPLSAPGMMNAAVDYLVELPPWQHLGHELSSNPHLNDDALQLIPWWHQARESWRHFEIPLWNHNAGSGYPLLASAVSAATSPYLLLTLPLTLGASLTVAAAWKILIALTFTYLYCRRRYSEVASCIAAVCYAFSGFIIVWLQYPQASVAAFAPAVLWDVDRLHERRTGARFAFSAFLWALILNSGHPETAAHLGFLAVLAAAWVAFVESRRPRTLITVVATITTGALMSAALIIPFLEAVTKSLRYEILKVAPHPTGILADWASTIAMLEPHFFGRLPFEKPWGPAIPETICGFVTAFAVAAGFAVAAHVVMTRRWRSREMFFVLATLIAIGIVYGWPGITQLFQLVFKLAANARLRYMLVLLLAIQAAAAADLLLSGNRRPVIIGLGAATLFYGAMLLFQFPSASQRDTAVLAVLPSLFVLSAALIALRWRYAGLVVILALSIADSWRVMRDWNPVLPDRALYPKTPMIEALLRMKEQSTAPFRVVGYGSVFFPNIAAMYDLEDIRTHDAMAGGRYTALLQLVAGVDRSAYFLMWWNKTTPLLDYLNVRYYVMSPGNELDGDPRFKLVYDGKDGRLWENTAVLPRFFAVDNVILDFDFNTFVAKLAKHTDWAHTALLNGLKVDSDRMRNDLLAPRAMSAPRARVILAESKPTHYTMHVSAPRHTLVVSSIPWWPGWKVTANNRRLRPTRVNGVFFGFVVPPGESDVRVWYSPASFWVGVWISGISCLAVLVLSRRRARGADQVLPSASQ